MFKDLKEYQEITRIYHESVNVSEEQRAINKAIAEANFTYEEISYLEENFDELWENELSGLAEEFITESIKEQNLTEEQLHEILGIASGMKAAGKIAKKAGPMIKKGISAVKKRIPQGVKDTVRGGVSVAKSAVKKISGAVKAGAKGAMKALPKVGLAAAGLGGAAVLGGKVVGALRNRGKKEREAKDAELQKKIDKGIKDSGMGDKGTAITQKGKEQAAFNRGERKARKDLNDPTLNLTKSELEAKKKTDPPVKKKKMSDIEKRNRARFGDAHVDKQKKMNADFKLMRSKKMSKDDFIKKYPKSITAQKAAGLRDHTEWDAYDMVLEYLFSTEQVSTLEEANYVMMEMDQTTIGDIVKEVTIALNENV